MATECAAATMPQSVLSEEQNERLDLRALLRLPRPLVIALLPWWAALVPAVWAWTTGRPWLAVLLVGVGLLFSVVAAAAVLVASAASAE